MRHDLLDSTIYEILVFNVIKFKCKLYFENKEIGKIF